MNPAALKAHVEMALQEDLGHGDITGMGLSHQRAQGRCVTEQDTTLSGMSVVVEVFRQVDESMRVVPHFADGDRVAPYTTLFTCSGTGSGLLAAERVALNYLQRMSGIATLTAQYVEAVEGTGVRIVDTRKTTPGMRMLEKHAVRSGGGHNHRLGLSDGVLIKENHIALAGGLTAAVEMVRETAGHTHKIEVEASTMQEVKEALTAGAEVIMLDNFTVEETLAAVKVIGDQALIEASGGIHLENVRQVAETGVQVISIGRLTHSAPAADISIDIECSLACPPRDRSA